jgi:glycosyltransferase involved in cell wall biosynthesis
MKILWKTNIILPMIAKDMGVEKTSIGGWLIGLANGLLKVKDIELAVCFPNGLSQMTVGKVENLKYYGFPEKIMDPSIYDASVESHLKTIVDDFKPDLVHIFGTEFPHSLSMVKVFGQPDRTLVNIQGLTSVYANLYSIGLSERVRNSYSFRDLMKMDNIRHQEKLFVKRGQYEIETLQHVNHVVGRTDWDEACTLQINPKRIYHFCNETLRDTFYDLSWDIQSIERHSIFLSQAHYPIKGLHFFLSVFPNILKKYPDAKLYISGHNIFRGDGFKDQLKQTYYAKYIKKLMVKHDLEKSIIFLGNLDEHQIAQRFLKSHVFVSPSTIENESNSLSEAKILGCPSVASFVGGVTKRIDQGVDGFLYPLNEPYMMEFYIGKIFDDDQLAIQISNHSKENAHRLLNRDNNLKEMLSIYHAVLKV